MENRKEKEAEEGKKKYKGDEVEEQKDGGSRIK